MGGEEGERRGGRGFSSLQARPPSSQVPTAPGAHLIRWVLHLLHVPSNHILRVLTCVDTREWARGRPESTPSQGLERWGWQGRKVRGCCRWDVTGVGAEGVGGTGIEIRRWR